MRTLGLRMAVPVAVVLVLSCHAAPAAKSQAGVSGSPAAPAPTAASASDTSLFARLGGTGGMQAIASGLGTRIAADARINPLFADSDLKAFETNFGKFLGGLCGGPALYQGPDMKTVHTGLGIADAQFDAMIEDLGAVLDELHVSPADRASVVARLQPLRSQIVGK